MTYTPPTFVVATYDKAPAPTMRKELATFAEAMEAKMQKNDHKTDWKTLPIEALFQKLLIEIEEFKVAQKYESVSEAQNELVDVANFCMMLFDRLGKGDSHA